MKRSILFISFLGAVLLMLLPSAAFALDFSWQNPSGDKSIFYLGQIFGPVGTALPNGTGNSLISSLFSIFNIAVLTLGSIVVSYTIILSTINTAQEGEVMGRKWSSLWIPLRSAIGMAFLIPTASGYSLLQMLMMEIVVYGIAAANQVWAQVVYAFSGNGTGLTGTVNIDQGQLKTVASNLLNSAVCQYVLNNNPNCRSALGGNTVTSYQMPNDNASLYFGVQGNSNYSQVCGSVTAGSTPSQALDTSSWQASNVLAFGLAASSLAGPASQIATGNMPTSTNIIYTTMNVLQGTISSAPQQQTTLTGSNADALNNGWLFAGSYYFVMISNGNNNITYTAPSSTGAPNSAQQGNLGSACTSALGTALGSNLTNYLSQSEVSGAGNGSSTSLTLPSVNTDPNVAQFMDAITGPIQSAMQSFMLTLTTNDPRGPVASLANVGANILNLAQDIWFAVMLVGLVVMLAGCTMSGIQPVCWALGAIITVLVPVLTVIISLLWGIGGMIGIYLPLVPYLVFTFTALGWMLLVIETIVAAPIVALGLVSPAGEHLGKAAPAVTLVVNVFMRPTLMVIGFATAAKLVDAAIDMLNYGFFATVQASVSGIGVFGSIALLALYGGTALAIIHECFSLIHVLPDKITRWIGGQAEQSQVKQQLAEAKKAEEKGSEIGAGIMKGSAGYMQEQGKKAMAKSSSGEGEGGGGKGGGAPGMSF